MEKTHFRFHRFSEQEKKMYPSVAKVVPNEDFTLTVTFDNGEEGILDMKPYLNFGVFERITDYEHFKRVRVAFDTIEWDRGVDLDPEFVYAKCKMTTPQRGEGSENPAGSVPRVGD